MEPKCLLPHLQESALGPYPDPGKSIPHPYIQFLEKPYPPTYTKVSKWSLPFGSSSWKFLCIYLLHACYMSIHLIFLGDQPNNI
jgi:hypothetical protein